MRILLLLGWVFMVSCKGVPVNNKDRATLTPQERRVFDSGLVHADNEFDGARLNDFRRLDDTTYQAFIKPENSPINNSPWFGFRIWSKKPTKISLEIVYPEDHEHRYIPKLSHDGIDWEPCEETQYEMDSLSGKLTLDLSLDPEKLWVSAQENLNSSYINDWVDSLAEKDFIHKEEIGKSVLGQPINLITIKKKTSKRSIIIIGRQHPPEVPGGTISLMAFVREILSDSDVAKNFRENFEILVFPLLNPDGVENGNWRNNANGVDLNRDWVSFSQNETRSVRDWLIHSKSANPGNKYCFGIDFHTSFSGPYLLTLDTLPHHVKPDITKNWIERIEFKRKEALDIRPRAQSLPYCYNWMINELGIEAVTYEEGDEIPRHEIKQRAKDYADVLMQILIEKYH